ncbi:MAG TPA: DEAD/DEAH box helicase [Actinomycetota bacterium]|nr:DEAD/DEAH box helicase [Actinomycetota bacterium]
MTTFLDLGVSRAVDKALARRGIEAPFPIQAMAIPDAMAGRDVLAKSQTGSGKTLAFAVPIAERIQRSDGTPAALVLVPTRELAVQVRDESADVSAAKGLKVAVAYGGMPLRGQAKAAAESHVLVATPGRLEDLLQRRLVKLHNVRILILDEADRMLDMGFQPQVDAIVRRIPPTRQTMFFSATLDGAVGRLSKAYTRDAVLHAVESLKETVDEADHRFVQVSGHGKVDALVKLLGADRGLALVFVRTKRGVDRLVKKLAAAGVRAAAMHGDMSQQARQRSLKRFENGSIDALVATDVAARGLDLSGITHVINYDPPQDHDGYVHRVGRTARAGRSGTGITLVTPDQQGDVGRMARHLALHDEFEEGGMKVPAPMVVYSSGGRRRRVAPRAARRR